jgi:DNA-binding NarL/FixJ family response regulator
MRTRVVILSSYLLLAEGIASRLRQYLCMADLEIVDPRQSDAIAQIAAAQPSVIILDGSDPGTSRFCSLSQLLHLLPKLRIICLDPEQDQVQVVTSEQCPVVKVHDLIEVIDRLA